MRKAIASNAFIYLSFKNVKWKFWWHGIIMLVLSMYLMQIEYFNDLFVCLSFKNIKYKFWRNVLINVIFVYVVDVDRIF